jgi:hypothetical protein
MQPAVLSFTVERPLLIGVAYPFLCGNAVRFLQLVSTMDAPAIANPDPRMRTVDVGGVLWLALVW